MRRSTKQAQVQQLSITLNGGLNYSQSPADIADNEIRRAMNFIYDASADYLITRPGTVCQTATPLGNPIIALYAYVANSTTTYIVCASGGKLYYLSGTSLDEWTEIGNLTDNTTVPSFLTFNTKLLIADGGDSIRIWDGASYSTISGSPKASVLSTIKGRVVANHVEEPDSVYLSAPYDAESADAWDIMKNAVGLKAGYGDILSVNAFSVFGDDLIISKVSGTDKKLYRVNVADPTTTNWYVKILSNKNAAQSAGSIVSAWNNVFFVDDNGFKSLKGVTEYGDLQVDPIGRKINTVFTAGYTCDFVAYLPTYNSIWFSLGDRTFCYSERIIAGSYVPSFTDVQFRWGRCRAACENNGIIYLGGYNGYLYKLDESASTDEVSPGVRVNYTSTVRTKSLAFFYDIMLRKIEWYLTPKASGAANLNLCYTDDEKVILSSITLDAEGQYLYEATDYLYNANQYLYDTGLTSWVETSRSRYRSNYMAFELEVVSGRVGVEWVKAEFAVLEGGD